MLDAAHTGRFPTKVRSTSASSQDELLTMITMIGPRSIRSDPRPSIGSTPTCAKGSAEATPAESILGSLGSKADVPIFDDESGGIIGVIRLRSVPIDDLWASPTETSARRGWHFNHPADRPVKAITQTL